MKATEKKIKNNILNSLYNLILNLKKNNNYNSYELSELILKIYDENIAYIQDKPQTEKNRIILNSLKNNSRCKVTKFLNKCNFNNIKYDVITDAFYMIFSESRYNTFKNLNLFDSAEYQATIQPFYKTNEQIEAQPKKFIIFINEVLYNFCYSDFVEIENENKEKIILKKDTFINFITAMNYKNSDFFILYGEDVFKPLYAIKPDRSGLILPCKSYE